jgi:hypothetical protein
MIEERRERLRPGDADVLQHAAGEHLDGVERQRAIVDLDRVGREPGAEQRTDAREVIRGDRHAASSPSMRNGSSIGRARRERSSTT